MRRPRSTSEPRREAGARRRQAGSGERPGRGAAHGAALGVVATPVAGAGEAAPFDGRDAAAKVSAGQVEDDRRRRRPADEEPLVDETAARLGPLQEVGGKLDRPLRLRRARDRGMHDYDAYAWELTTGRYRREMPTQSMVAAE